MLKKINPLSLGVPLIVGAISVQAKPLSLDRIFGGGSLSGTSPGHLIVSPVGFRGSDLHRYREDKNRY
ncbi:hypothetical protein CWB63_18515, partial [Pseudoalteromonas sp. S409]|uniref:hypothetical protein n=1 Tax=Pseudoalteromonas sp. S409 TaxID=2066518 RepID=UPI0011081A03